MRIAEREVSEFITHPQPKSISVHGIGIGIHIHTYISPYPDPICIPWCIPYAPPGFSPPNPLSICESVFPCFSSHISTYSPMWSIGRAKDYEFSLWPTIRVASLANAPRLRISPEPFAFLFNY